MKRRIDSTECIRMIATRLATVEPVFGNLQHNKRLARLTQRRPDASACPRMGCFNSFVRHSVRGNMTSEPVLVYHFENTNKFYLGCEPADPCPISGNPLVPYSATLVRPPLLSTRGEKIACFDEVAGEWQIRENNFWRPKVREFNYDAGRKMATYAPIQLSIYKDFPAYPSIPMICSGAIVAINISERFRHVHQKFESICQLHKLVISRTIEPPNTAEMGEVFAPHMTYKMEVEALVYHMRRILDSLTQLTYLITNKDEFNKNKAIAHNEIGRVVDIKTANNDFEAVLIGNGNEYTGDSTGFLATINSLFNGFKHCLMHEESCILMGVDTPTIVSYHAKNNNHNNEIVYHNHNAFHIMMGFQDNVIRIIENQKLYQQINA